MATSRKPQAAEPAETATPQHVLLAPTVEERLSGLCMQGVYAKNIAGLLRLCAESIYSELAALEKGYPGALVQHSQDMTDHIDYLADTIHSMGEKIETEAGEAVEVVRMIGGAA